MGRKPMWTCPKCGRSFANLNQSHTCGTLRSIDDHLAGKPGQVVDIFRTFAAAVEACGPAQILAEKTPSRSMPG